MPSKERHAPNDPILQNLDRMLDASAKQNPFEIPFAKRIADFEKRKDVSVEEYEHFARDLYNQYIASDSFGKSLKRLQILISIIQFLTNKLSCFCDVARVVESYAAQQMFAMPLSTSTISGRRKYVKSLIDEYGKAHKEEYKKKNYKELFAASLSPFLIDFYILNNAIPFSSYLKKQMTENLSLTDGDALEFRMESDMLWREILAAQSYTLKQSYYVDPLTNYQAGWAIIDPQQAEIGTRGCTGVTDVSYLKVEKDKYSGAFAEFVMMTSTEVSEGLSKDYSPVRGQNRAMSGGPEYSFPVNDSHIYHLDFRDGEIYYQLYPVRISLREVFSKINAEPQYHYLRMSFLARLADMVLPRIIVDALPPLSEMPQRIQSAQQNTESNTVGGVIVRDFVVPRRKALRNKEALQLAYQTEEKQYEQEQVQNKISRQFLGRVGHPRRLAKGYHSHPDAKKFAKEDGFHRELEDNETWCRPIESPMSVVFKQKSYDD